MDIKHRLTVISMYSNLRIPVSYVRIRFASGRPIGPDFRLPSSFTLPTEKLLIRIHLINPDLTR